MLEIYGLLPRNLIVSFSDFSQIYFFAAMNILQLEAKQSFLNEIKESVTAAFTWSINQGPIIGNISW
jgi:hypothetical protein